MRGTWTAMADHLVNVFASAVGMLWVFAGQSSRAVQRDHRLRRVGLRRLGRANRLRRHGSSHALPGVVLAEELRSTGRAAEVPSMPLAPGCRSAGEFGNITYPVNSPLAVTMGFAVSEAIAGNYADAMEAIDDCAAPAGAGYLIAWVKAVIYGLLSAGPTSSIRSRTPNHGPIRSWPPPRRCLTASRRRTWACSTRPNGV